MAMNKKEQAAFEALQEELRIAKAFRFTDKIKPDIAPPSVSDFGPSRQLTKGFLFNAYSRQVEPGCSGSIYHGRGRDERATSQHSVWLYSSRLLALKAMRNEVEQEFAKELAKIDRQIEEEVSK